MRNRLSPGSEPSKRSAHSLRIRRAGPAGGGEEAMSAMLIAALASRNETADRVMSGRESPVAAACDARATRRFLVRV